MIPKCRKKNKVFEETVVNSYVRLFTTTVTNIWKCFNILFYLTDTQNGAFSQLCNLTIQKTNTGLNVKNFKGVCFGEDITNSLIAVVKSNEVEVFYKMGGAQSPTLQILSETRLRNADTFGKVEIDMNFVTATLPERYSCSYFKYIKIGRSSNERCRSFSSSLRRTS